MQSGQTGPGGCKTPEECKKVCEDNPDQCKNFQQMPGGQSGPAGAGEGQNFQPGPGAINPGGQTMPQQAGPGGCKGPEECKTYCETNPDQCKNFGSGGGQGQFAPVTGSTKPCEGENCQQIQQMFKPGTEPIKCEGDKCPPAGIPSTGVNQGGSIAPRFIEGQKLPEGQIMAPPGAPIQGTGISPENLPATGFPSPANMIAPPTQGNLLPPSGNIAPPPATEPPPSTPPPPAPPSGSLELKSFMAQMLNFFFGIQ